MESWRIGVLKRGFMDCLFADFLAWGLGALLEKNPLESLRKL
jgi:hypothetical protein